MIGNDPTHRRCVESWLAERVGSECASDRTAPALIVGVGAVWDRARPALGEVTLGAIFRRAIETGARRHAALAALGLRITDSGDLIMSNLPAPRAELREGVTFLLAELLRVLALLSGGALTLALHAALTNATLDAPRTVAAVAGHAAPTAQHHHTTPEHQPAET